MLTRTLAISSSNGQCGANTTNSRTFPDILQHLGIKVTRDDGVTVGDVLKTIHHTLLRRISHDEWNRLSLK